MTLTQPSLFGDGPELIGLVGYAQAGKDTLAKVLVEEYGYTRLAFADAIRDFAYAVNPMYGSTVSEPRYLRDLVDRSGWDEAKKSPEVRRLLQTIGVTAREQFGGDFWIAITMSKVNTPNVVITDVRFENEAEWIKDGPSSQLWRVTRSGVGPVNDHVSESELADYPVDQIFKNDGSIEDLENLVRSRMSVLAEA